MEIKKQPDGTSRGFAFVTFAEKVSKRRPISPGMETGIVRCVREKERLNGKYEYLFLKHVYLYI